MRLISRVLVLIVICLTAIALLPLPAQAQCGGPFLELTPESGLPDTEVSIYGYDFAEGVLVDIYYDGNPIATERTSSRGDFTIFFTIPECGKGHYQVLAAGKYSSSDTYFTVKPGLTVTPDDGPIGTTVTVKGQGFSKNEEGIELMYYFNDSYETIERNIVANANGSWERSFQIPPSSRGEHKIDAQSAVTRYYEVQDAIFRVTAEISIDKSSGIAGDTITMTGSRFAANEKGIKILLNGQAIVTDIKANFEGEWEASFEVPTMPAGDYGLIAEGERTKIEDLGELNFEIKPYIVLSPDEGHIGTDLTLTGRGFAANENVIVTYDGNQIATTETNEQGSFDVSFLVPESKYGEHNVAAGYSGQNAASTIFTMESDPPDTPKLISPANRSRLGIRGEVTPTFEWSAVSDDSGVHYNLQIATSANFTAPSVIVSVTGLAETSYIMHETDALPYGTYYWTVQAVDGAENESDWTAVYSFRVGLLPLWGLIVAITAGVVLLILVIRVLLRRRNIYYDSW